MSKKINRRIIREKIGNDTTKIIFLNLDGWVAVEYDKKSRHGKYYSIHNPQGQKEGEGLYVAFMDRLGKVCFTKNGTLPYIETGRRFNNIKDAIKYVWLKFKEPNR